MHPLGLKEVGHPLIATGGPTFGASLVFFELPLLGGGLAGVLDVLGFYFVFVAVAEIAADIIHHIGDLLIG